MIIFRH